LHLAEVHPANLINNLPAESGLLLAESASLLAARITVRARNVLTTTVHDDHLLEED
jgi:hypothetical protein